jgi:hypothetical protein
MSPGNFQKKLIGMSVKMKPLKMKYLQGLLERRAGGKARKKTKELRKKDRKIKI